MSKGETEAAQGPLARAHALWGWVGLFAWLTFGTALELLHGFKTPAYLEDAMRRELWTLAHFHGAVLSVVNVVYVRWADTPSLSAAARRSASRALRAGSVLLPLGFLLGGVAHYEGDPGVGIFLAPVGAVCVLFAVGRQAIGAARER